MASSRSTEWRTPPEIWNPINAEFQFDLDAAANESNALTPRFLTDALGPDPWPGSVVWLNPPYGRMLEPFIRRAAKEAERGITVVALIPLRVRAAWWHEAVLGRAHEVRCVRKRVRFLRPDGTRPAYGLSNDSCLVVWRGAPSGQTLLTGFKQAE